MPTYTDRTTVAEYLEDTDVALPADGAAADRLIEKAERQVDQRLVGYRGGGAGGLKLDPAKLDVPGETWKRDSLARAVAAQVQYRLTMGEDFMTRDQHASVSSPDGTVQGRLRKLGPQVLEELAGTGLVLAGATLTTPASTRAFPKLPRG